MRASRLLREVRADRLFRGVLVLVLVFASSAPAPPLPPLLEDMPKQKEGQSKEWLQRGNASLTPRPGTPDVVLTIADEVKKRGEGDNTTKHNKEANSQKTETPNEKKPTATPDNEVDEGGKCGGKL